MAAMYALAFVSDDIEYIVTEALKTIPAESTYHQCVSDAIRWSKENADWKTTWKLIEEKWCDGRGGVYRPAARQSRHYCRKDRLTQFSPSRSPLSFLSAALRDGQAFLLPAELPGSFFHCPVTGRMAFVCKSAAYI